LHFLINYKHQYYFFSFEISSPYFLNIFYIGQVFLPNSLVLWVLICGCYVYWTLFLWLHVWQFSYNLWLVFHSLYDVYLFNTIHFYVVKFIDSFLYCFFFRRILTPIYKSVLFFKSFIVIFALYIYILNWFRIESTWKYGTRQRSISMEIINQPSTISWKPSLCPTEVKWYLSHTRSFHVCVCLFWILSSVLLVYFTIP
jgi:hypothetical protein